MLNILVLGATGYIGKKVVKKLTDKGYRIFCIKRHTTNTTILSNEANVEWVPNTDLDIDSLFEKEHIGCILNMACDYGRGSREDNIVIDANLSFPLRILSKYAVCQGGKFITIGTALPRNINMYSYSKSMLNEFGKYYSEKYDIKFCCLNLQMFYGADEPKDRFLPSVIRKMISGERVDTTIGTQRRDIISVEDVVSAIETMVDADIKNYEEISIGTGKAPTVSELVDYIWEITGKKSLIDRGAIPMRDNEPDCKANVDAISQYMNWSPVEWKIGIYDMVESIKHIHKKEN